MADNIKGITVEIGGETTGLSKALQGVNKESASVSKELRAVESVLKLDPTNVEMLAQKQELLGKAVESAAKKVDALREAQKQVDEQFNSGAINGEAYRAFQREVATAEGSLKKAEKAVQDFGDQSKTTDTKIENTGSEIKKLGTDLDNAGKKALSFGDVLKANVIGQAIVGGVKALGGAIEGLASDALEGADSIQQMADQTGLSAEKIQELSYVGDTLGVDIDTVTGSFSKLINNMSSASAGTGTAYEAFSKLGVSVTDSSGNLRDSNDVFNDVINALGNVSDMTTRTAIAQDIFGKSAADLNPLISAGADQLSELAQQAYNTGAIMSGDTVGALDDLGDTVEQLKTSVTSMAGSLLEKLLPAIQPIIDEVKNIDVTPIADFLTFIIDNSSTVVAGLAAIGAGFVAFKVTSIIQGAVTAFETFKKTTEAATVAQWALDAAASAFGGPIGIIVTAIAALVAGVVVLWNTNEGFRNAVISAWESIQEGINTAITAIVGFFTETIPNAFSSVITWFASLPGTILQFFADILTGFTTWAASVGAWIAQAIPNIIASIIAFFNDLPYKIGYAIGYTIGTLIKWAEDLVTWITTNVPLIIDNIITFYKELPGKIWDAIIFVITKLGEWATSVIEWITTNVPIIISNVISFFIELPGKIGGAIAGAVGSIITWASDLISAAGEKLPEVISSIVGFFESIPGKMLDIGENLIKGLWDGISNAKDWVLSKIGEFCDGIVDGIQGFFAIGSPSKVMRDQVGVFLAQGIGVGFTDQMKNVTKDMQNSMPTDFDMAINAAYNNSAVIGGDKIFEVVTPISIGGQNLTKVVSRIQYSERLGKARALGVSAV